VARGGSDTVTVLLFLALAGLVAWILLSARRPGDADDIPAGGADSVNLDAQLQNAADSFSAMIGGAMNALTAQFGDILSTRGPGFDSSAVMQQIRELSAMHASAGALRQGHDFGSFLNPLGGGQDADLGPKYHMT